jgi:hypothetical protein
LGVAQRMVENIVSLTIAMGLMQMRTGKLTPLGAMLQRADPYLTAPLTPWLLHYNLGANPRHLVWHRMANEVVPSLTVLTMEDARAKFDDLHETHSAYSVRQHVSKELRVFFEAYEEGGLSSLGYFWGEDGRYQAPAALRVPPPAFGYALLAYSAEYRPGVTALPIEEVAAAPSSPGRVFRMRETDVREHLEKLHRLGIISIENRGHLDQARMKEPVDPAGYLEAHFADTEEGW